MLSVKKNIYISLRDLEKKKKLNEEVKVYLYLYVPSKFEKGNCNNN